MRAGRWQTTLTGPCTASGRGYWSGAVNTLTFLPAPVGTGIRFVRTDLPEHPYVQAIAENRVSMSLRTRLRSEDCEVDMVEHVMAALYGLRVDNVEVHCTAAEMPGMDGSSLAFALALDSIGTVDLRTKRPALVVTESMRFGDDAQWIQVEPVAGNFLELEYRLNYGSDSPIGKATYRARVDENAFFHELAPARTFISRSDAEQLQAQGIAQHVTDQDLIVFDQDGPVNNNLRFEDECARHKALDLLGDLALSGIDLIGRVTACRSGHKLNGFVAEQLRKKFVSQMNSSRAA